MSFQLGRDGRAAVAAAVTIVAAALCGHAAAADYKGRTISMIIGSEAGGGTDASGRLLAAFFEKYLPGNPSVVVRNMPGAEGVTALNYVVQQTRPDGLTLVVGAAVQLSPLTYRRANGAYDPLKLRYIGGLGRGGTEVLISTAQESRLRDKSTPPLFFGVLDGTRAGEQFAFWGIEYLDWNAKVVVGYRGTADVMLALERGEIDMNATGNMFQIQKLLDSGKYKILLQTGSLENGVFVPLPRADFGSAPVLADLMRDRRMEPAAKQAYDFWQSITALDKWLGLTEGTPDDIVADYRTAFDKLIADPQFLERGRKLSEDITPTRARDVELLVGKLAAVTDEAEAYLKNLLRKNGVNVK